MADAQTDPAQEAAKKAADDAKMASRWIAELGVSEKAQSKWLNRAKKISRRYKKEGDDSATGKRKFALLWSNTETIRPAVYANPPQPLVSRRFKDADPTGRLASEVLERSLTYSVDKQDLDATLRSGALDYVLIARGQAWERYVPTHGPQVTPEIALQVTTDAVTGEESYTDDDGKVIDKADVRPGEEEGSYVTDGEPYEPVIFEESITDYVNWDDFGHSASRTWDEVSYVWRRVYMDRDALIDRFGDDLGKIIPLDWGPRTNSRTSGVEDDNLIKKAAVYEIWDKPTKCVYWISKSYSTRPLDHREDPLGLDGFFPCPRPLLGTTANDSLMPVPDYVYYQDQAEEIDDLTARIATLQDALKVKGFYASSAGANLDNLFASDSGTLIPVPGWQSFKEDGGLKGMIDYFPIEMVASTLTACITLRAQLLEDVYQITGVADILRGSSDPGETATAQRIKGHWGPLRIRDKQKEMQRFARDILRIKGEVIAEKFSVETLRAMTGMQIPTAAEKAQLQAQIAQMQAMAQQQAAMAAQQPPAANAPPGAPPPPQAAPSAPMGHNGGPPMELPPGAEDILASPTWEDVKGLLQDNAMRQFRIDIETDSTIEPNESDEKAQTVEFMQAMGSFFAQIGPLIAAQPQAAPMFGEMIKFAARRFRIGNQLEAVIDSTIDKLAQQAPASAAGPAAPPPDTTPIQVAQIDQQTEQIKQQGETDRARIAAQTQMQDQALTERDQALTANDQQLSHGDQQLKAVALTRDPTPQAIG